MQHMRQNLAITCNKKHSELRSKKYYYNIVPDHHPPFDGGICWRRDSFEKVKDSVFLIVKYLLLLDKRTSLMLLLLFFNERSI